jgi:hypothetical protein
MSKEKQDDVRTYDLRTLERNFKRGLLSRKEYEKHLKSLPDAKDKVMPMTEWNTRREPSE